MARADRRDAEPGWLISFLGAAVLIAGGFVVGLVVGVVSEEPELVVGHLAGKSEEVSWLAEEPAGRVDDGLALGSDARGVATGGPAEALGSEVAVELPSVAAARPKAITLPPVAAGPLGARTGARSIEELPTVESPRASSDPAFAVQVGAFSDATAAGRVRDDLRRKGFDVYLVTGTRQEDQRSRVRVGPVASKSDAQALADRLKREERLPTWVLEEHGS